MAVGEDGAVLDEDLVSERVGEDEYRGTGADGESDDWSVFGFEVFEDGFEVREGVG